MVVGTGAVMNCPVDRSDENLPRLPDEIYYLSVQYNWETEFGRIIPMLAWSYRTDVDNCFDRASCLSELYLAYGHGVAQTHRGVQVRMEPGRRVKNRSRLAEVEVGDVALGHQGGRVDGLGVVPAPVVALEYGTGATHGYVPEIPGHRVDAVLRQRGGADHRMH